ncbi:hypothetical protein HK104_007758, partial [Borealophlyctis nickersoniae]
TSGESTPTQSHLVSLPDSQPPPQPVPSSPSSTNAQEFTPTQLAIPHSPAATQPVGEEAVPAAGAGE